MLFYFSKILKLLFFMVRFRVVFAGFHVMRDLYFFRSDDQKKVLNLNETFFSSLENYQVNAKPVTEKEYPWIARVVHSRTRDVPYMCTASCIHEGVFITAARCIISLKVKHTSVIYKSKRLAVRAFVLPSIRTSQQFDDIGFLVIENNDNVTYNVVKLFDGVKRTDEVFNWFKKMDFSGKYIVVGYATDKGIHRIKSAEREFSLKELFIAISYDICSTILTNNHKIKGFEVPCYHSCTIKEFRNKTKKCQNYHGVEGGAIIDVKGNKLLGLAIWGPYFFQYELPVGFSVLNSNSFFEDYECAKKVRVADVKSSETYQKFCD